MSGLSVTDSEKNFFYRNLFIKSKDTFVRLLCVHTKYNRSFNTVFVANFARIVFSVC